AGQTTSCCRPHRHLILIGVFVTFPTGTGPWRGIRQNAARPAAVLAKEKHRSPAPLCRVHSRSPTRKPTAARCNKKEPSAEKHQGLAHRHLTEVKGAKVHDDRN